MTKTRNIVTDIEEAKMEYKHILSNNIAYVAKYSKASENTNVVYMAFDGVPRLGFIITVGINQSFKKTLKKATEKKLKVFVETYEPHLNNRFIEKNGFAEQYAITICKPHNCEPIKQKRAEMCDGSIVSVNSAKSIVTAIARCPDIVKQNRKNTFADRFVAFCGAALSVVLAIIACFNDSLAAFGWINSHLSILLIIFTVLGMLPGMIATFKFKKNNDIRQQSPNGDQNSNERKA